MIKNYDDVKQYIDGMDEQFYLDFDYEHSFIYLCGKYAPYPAICYIQKEYFQYKVQFVPIDRKITYSSDEWIIFEDIEEFIWNNRYNIYYSKIPYTELFMDIDNNSVANEGTIGMRGYDMGLNYKFTSNRKGIEYWEIVADQILQKLIDTNVLSEEYRIRISATTEETVFYRLYGICNGVILIQQNYSCKKRIYGEWHTKQKYFVTDGQNIELVSTPLRYLKTDGSVDGVLKYFASKLTNECLKNKILGNEYIEGTVVS